MQTQTDIFKMLEKRYDRRFKDVSITCEQLMKIHRSQFKIIDNLHDLMCKGNKDYKLALSIIQDYNMTKILSNQFSVPDESGLAKNAVCHFDPLFSVMYDIEIYNYIDWLLRLREMDALKEQIYKGNLNPDKKNFDIDEYSLRQ